MITIHRHDLHNGITGHPTGNVRPVGKVGRLLSAVRRWNRAGRPIATRPERQKRSALCKVCEHWSPLGNFGLGECKAPGCGCTRAKVWLATERCPLGKW